MAIQLYIGQTNLVRAVTLAGAAEEILGKLVRQEGKKTAFEDVLNRLCEMHKLAFNEHPDRKAYADLRNGTRNEFKHLCSGAALSVNLDREASQLIHRAIENYQKLSPSFYLKFKQFEQAWLQRHGQVDNTSS